MVDSDASCPGIISNPDLVGIGTRINFYVTIFLAAVVPQHKYTNELLDELYVNAVFYGFALLVTVLVQTIKGQLDLYHAIFVIHLLSCLEVFQFYGLRRFLWAKRVRFKLRMTILAQVCQDAMIWPPWLFYMWIKVSRFGAQPECNHLVKYVFVFITIRATVNWLRIFFLVFASFGLFCLLITLRIFWKLKFLFVDSDEASEIERDYYSTMDYSGSSFLLAVYGIVTSELIVHRNRTYVQAGENSWGFGQVVSVLLLLPIFIEILAVLKRFISGVTHRKEGQAEGEAAEGEAVALSNAVTAV